MQSGFLPTTTVYHSWSSLGRSCHANAFPARFQIIPLACIPSVVQTTNYKLHGATEQAVFGRFRHGEANLPSNVPTCIGLVHSPRFYRHLELDFSKQEFLMVGVATQVSIEFTQ